MDTQKELNYRLYIQRENDFKRTSFSNEFERYKDIQSGDVNRVRKNLKVIKENYLLGKGELSKDPIRNVRYHVIISTAIIARVCVEGGMPHDEAYALSDIYIQRIDELDRVEEIVNLLEEMQIDFATRMKNRKKNKAMSVHIRKCVDYIYEHLQEKITVEHLAEYVDRNPSYLSKLFHEEVGIPIHSFVTKARITTAENMLSYSDFSYLKISMSLGFSSQSAFINVFKKETGLTPKEYRKKTYKKELL